MALVHLGANLGSKCSSPPPPQPARAQKFPFEQALINCDEQMDQYEREDMQELALTHVPIDQLYNTASEIQSSLTPLPSFDDALAEALVKWFKPNFMEWVDPMLCTNSLCKEEVDDKGQPTGKKVKMKMRRMDGPRSAEEKQGGAGRVEVHACPNCGTESRFPRYNSLESLMKSRKGRCGEFANLFTVFLRAIGLRARYVWNAEDHVWNEYYSTALNRWVHLDSCENARDQHHLYSKGWGKKMSLVVAFSVDGGAMDVSRTYIPEDKWDEAMRMRQYSDTQLEEVLQRIRARRRGYLSKSELERLEAEDYRDHNWWKASNKSGAEGNQIPEGESGRKSGTTEWTEARGEAGK
ncbi:uncharacterized protein EI90DRAFT_3041291 [Cantharellus anzutake]|uniref:uncharacterized protein n=1 Tax=Cantharellus anzutake TaxID=1750568 RepID=UPI001907BA99|nr:uncharacterized protein EI90DRAFT_3041291 [Cantharellus anzutake]KAF8338006.1 hypothetical protein EI90DRAFT_3041291 [Cantharellus anzutake]